MSDDTNNRSTTINTGSGNGLPHVNHDRLSAHDPASQESIRKRHREQIAAMQAAREAAVHRSAVLEYKLEGERLLRVYITEERNKLQSDIEGSMLRLTELQAELDVERKLRERVQRQRDRLQRACEEGLPRECILCPKCGMQHIDGADGSEYGQTPHHTHQCQKENGGCGHVFDTGRWSYGDHVSESSEVKLRRDLEGSMVRETALRQDIEHLAKVVGRKTRSLRFVSTRGTSQTPTVHVLADGTAYAPILGPSTPPCNSLNELIRLLEREFGDGFKYTEEEGHGA